MPIEGSYIQPTRPERFLSELVTFWKLYYLEAFVKNCFLETLYFLQKWRDLFIQLNHDLELPA